SGLVVGTALLVAGCGSPPNDKGTQAKNAKKTGKSGKTADEWWCPEHGIPEDICSLCLPEAKVKKLFKDKGDWCNQHDRAKSQCFKCDPKKYEMFEAMYKEEFNGETPPRPLQEEFEK